MKSKLSQWKAGVATVDITPSEPLWLHGWGHRAEPMTGVSQHIFVKALALQDSQGQRAVFVTSDLLGFSRTMTATIAQRAKKRFGLDRAQLILNASHNHSGPVTGDVLPLYFDLSKRFSEVRDRYTARLLDQVVDAIGAALRDLSPAALAFGQGLAGIAVNRRRARGGGRPLTTAVDPDVPVLTVRSPKGELRAVMFGYACHTTCVNDGTLNGDYAGFAQHELEAMFPGAIALFVQGCGGDANPLPRWDPGLGESYGRILALSVKQVIQGNVKPVAGPLRVAFAEAELPFEKLPTRNELASALVDKAEIRRREIQYQLSLLKKGDRRWRALRYPIHVAQLGSDLKLIALSSETVSDYALRFKATYGWDNTWVSGYNDDYWCYIPSLRVWREGGYEGHTGMLECQLPGPFAPTVEEIIAATVDELVQETSGSPRPYPRRSRHE